MGLVLRALTVRSSATAGEKIPAGDKTFVPAGVGIFFH